MDNQFEVKYVTEKFLLDDLILIVKNKSKISDDFDTTERFIQCPKCKVQLTELSFITGNCFNCYSKLRIENQFVICSSVIIQLNWEDRLKLLLKKESNEV